MLPDRRWTTNRRLVAAAAIVGLLALVTAGSTTAAEPYVLISDATVSDDEPLPGERIVITPTVQLSDGADTSVKVTSVSVEVPEGAAQGEHAYEIGTLSPGDSVDVPVGVSFDETGTRRVIVHARGVEYDADGDIVGGWDVQYPVHVEIVGAAAPEPDPRLRIEHEPLVVGHTSTVDVTVSNGGEYAIRDLDVALRSDGSGVVAERHRYHPLLDGSTDRTFTFEVTPRGAGLTTLNATLDYEYGDRIVVTELANVAELRDDVTVHASTVSDNGTRHLQYRVTNRGNAPIDEVVLSGASGDTELPGAAAGRLAPASSATRRVALSDAPVGAVQVSAAYTLDGDRETVTREIDLGTPTPAATATQSATRTDTSAPADLESGAGPLGDLDPLTTLLTGLGLGGVAAMGYRRVRTQSGGSDPRAPVEEPAD